MKFIISNDIREMPDHSQPDKRSPRTKNTKDKREEEQLLTPQQIVVGSFRVKTHKERQEYLKKSELGKKLGIGDLVE